MSRNRRFSILFVDDEPNRTQNYVEYLKLDGFKVTECSYLEEIGNQFKKHTKFDLVILDIIMKPKPLENADFEKGDITRAGLKKGIPILRDKNTPILILTNLALEKIQKEDLIGVDVVGKLYKPLTAPSALSETIKMNVG